MFRAPPDLVDGIRLPLELLNSFRRDSVDLLAFHHLGDNQPLILKKLKRRIDCPSARAVEASASRFELLDQLIAVLRTLAQQRKDSQPNLTRLKKAAPAAKRAEGCPATPTPTR